MGGNFRPGRVEVVHDPLPIRNGAPGLYGFTPVNGYFDNVKITANKPL